MQAQWTADYWAPDIHNEFCEYQPIAVLQEAYFDVLAPSIDTITPAIGSVGGKITVSIDGNGLMPGTIVNPIPGITFSDYNYGQGTGIFMGVVFNIIGNATPGNNSVSVSKAGANSNSVDFYVQKPVTATVDELFTTVIVDPGPGDIKNAFGQVLKTGICGAYKNILYTLVDQNSEPLELGFVDPNIGLLVTEILTDYQSSGDAPPLNALTLLTNNVAKFSDVQAAFSNLPCLQPFSYSLKQKFKVVVDSVEFLLTVQNAIAVSHPSSGQWTITITIITT